MFYFTCSNCGGQIESPPMPGPAFSDTVCVYTQHEEISAWCFNCNTKYVRYYPEVAIDQGLTYD